MSLKIKMTIFNVLGLSCLMICSPIQSQSAVTYLARNEWGGRLGDMLIMYVKAKWVAFHYNLPLLYKPFAYSDELELHFKEQYLHHHMLKDYKKRITCKDAPEHLDSLINPKENALYTVHYYFNLPHWGECQKKYDSQEIMTWPEIYNDRKFLQELKKNIAPHTPLQLHDIPTDKISVAVHVRMGGGFDHPLLSRQLYSLDSLDAGEEMPANTYSDKYWPLKFVPLQYYVDQIKRLSEMLNDDAMYVHIYTDDKDPVTVMNTIAAAVNKTNIVFNCRKDDNHHSKNVLEDLFSMARYHCLIRSGTNYPQISQLIGNHRIVIYPKSCKWIGNTMIVDDVGTFVR